MAAKKRAEPPLQENSRLPPPPLPVQVDTSPTQQWPGPQAARGHLPARHSFIQPVSPSRTEAKHRPATRIQPPPHSPPCCPDTPTSEMLEWKIRKDNSPRVHTGRRLDGNGESATPLLLEDSLARCWLRLFTSIESVGSANGGRRAVPETLVVSVTRAALSWRRLFRKTMALGRGAGQCS